MSARRSARRRRFQAAALVLGLLVAPVAVVPAHDAARCCPPEQTAAPCHGEADDDCLSRAAMTCCAPAPAFPIRPGVLFEHPSVQAPPAAFEAASMLEPSVALLAGRAAALSARASPLHLSVVLRI